MQYLRCLLLGVWIVGGLGVCAYAQPTGKTGSVEGSVIDGQTNEPLAGAAVYLLQDSSQQQATTTQRNGRFAFEGVAQGTATVKVRFLGYKTARQTVHIRPDKTAAVDLKLVAKALRLDDVHIIAQRDSLQQQLPGTATRLGLQEVRQIDAVGTQELLTHVPGVHGFADDGMGNSRMSIGIRGLQPRRTSRVLVLEDGIPIQPAPYIFPPVYYNPPIERIAEVEVIKSSAAIKHGPQTMGGVINYITSRPRAAFGGTAQVTTGMNGYVSAFGELEGWGNQQVVPELQLLFKQGDGFRANNDFYQFNGTFKLHVRPGSDRTFYLKANLNAERTNATYTGLTRYSFQNSPAFNTKAHDIYQVFRGSVDLIYNRRYSDVLNSATKVYANVFHRPWWREKDVFVRAGTYTSDDPENINPVPWYTPGPLLRIGGGQSNYGNIRTFYVGGAERRYDFKHHLFGQEAQLEAGGRLHWERFADNRKIGDSPGTQKGVFYTGSPDTPKTLNILGQSHHYETTALALHALEKLHLGALRVEPGLRLELFEQERVNRLQDSRYRDKTSLVLLPGVGINYNLGAYNLFGGVHRGYTPPSSATLKIVNFAAGSDTTRGLDLRPEKSWNTEAGLRGRGSWGSFEATAFHLYIQDLVGGRTVFKNLGQVQTYGLELASTLGASALWAGLPDMHLSYTYLQTEVLKGRISSALKAGGVTVDIAGNELPYAPHHTLVAGLSKKLSFGLDMRANLRYVSRTYTDLENIEQTSNRGDMGPVPAYIVVDASASYPITSNLSARVTAKNLLDNIYIGSRLHSDPHQPQAHMSSGILPGPRRQVNVTLRYNF